MKKSKQQSSRLKQQKTSKQNKRLTKQQLRLQLASSNPKQRRKKHRSLKNSDDTHYQNIFDNNVNFRERVIYLNDDIDDYALEIISKAFDEFEREPSVPVRIEISSYGGSIYSMFGIVDRIKSSPCEVTTRGFGQIMSAATLILASGDHRMMGSASWFMIHQLSDWIRGTLAELKVEIEHSDQLQTRINQLYSFFTKGKTSPNVFKKLSKKDSYLTAEQTLELGLIDEII